MFGIQYILSAFSYLTVRKIYRCVTFYHVKELGSLHNPERILI